MSDIYTSYNTAPEHFEFNQKYGLGVGATNSHHHVFFGRGAIKNAEGQVLLQGEIAVKPFLDSPDRAFYEYGFNRLMLQRGLDAFMPLAIVREENKSYLVTAFDPSLITLDNVNWFYTPEDGKFKQEIIPLLKQVGMGLAELHAVGVFHGDAKVKNLAVSEEQQFRVVDLEGAVYIQNQSNSAELRIHIVGDLLNFYSSLKDRGFLEGKKAQENFEAFTHFFDIYTEEFRKKATGNLKGINNLLACVQTDLLEYMLIEESFGGEM